MNLVEAFQVHQAEKTDKQAVDNLLRFANEEDVKTLDRSIINYDNLLPIDILRTRYKAVSVDRKVKRKLVKRKGTATKILNYRYSEEQPSEKLIGRMKKIKEEQVVVSSTDYELIERLFPFDFEAIHSHGWFFLSDKIGTTTCFNCSGEKYVICSKCDGEHEWTCSSCNGSGEDDCSSCGGDGEDSEWVTDHEGNSSYESVTCSSCGGSGEDRCSRCGGDGDITCSRCYGDNRDNRYGKVDCPVCDAIGELIYFEYIETEINSFERNSLVTHRFGRNVPLDKRLNERLHDKYLEIETGETVTTFQHTNAHITEDYRDDYMTFISRYYCEQQLFAKENTYPLILEEEMSYQQLPFFKVEYAFMADINEPHHLLLRNYEDQTQIVLGTTIKDKKYDAKTSFSTWIDQDLSTKSQVKLDDEFRSIVFMAHMAKSDGFICYDEKKYIASRLSPIYEQLSRKSQRYINEMLGYEKPTDIKKKYAKLSSKTVIPETFLKVDAFLKANNMEKEGEVLARYEDLYNMVDWYTPKYYSSVLHTVIWVSLTLFILFIVFQLVAEGVI